MTDPKQEIHNILYQFKGGERVLDVGCGDGIAPVNVEYEGVDLKFGMDWWDHKPGDYDIIIANDIFPNVDQRLELFLDKYLPHCKEMRLSLTYFDKPKWYRAKRVDGDEILTILQWDINRTFVAVLSKIMDYRYEEFSGIFDNGRKVLLVWMKGGLS